ncbi:hypothetical protein [Xanthomonas sacchari]|nr:hypothetical protein [Xanthomonas sacchari]
MSGAEYKAWQLSDWGGAWWEEYELSVNGVVVDDVALEDVKDADKIVIQGGVIFTGETDREGRSVAWHFNRWKKAQTTAFVSVEVSKDDVQALQVLLTQFGQGRKNFKVTVGG